MIDETLAKRFDATVGLADLIGSRLISILRGKDDQLALHAARLILEYSHMRVESRVDEVQDAFTRARKGKGVFGYEE